MRIDVRSGRKPHNRCLCATPCVFATAQFGTTRTIRIRPQSGFPRTVTSEPTTPNTGSLASDTQRSLRVAGNLGLSLIATWAVALGVRLALPRVLGPIDFGNFQFADAFTTTIFIVSTLGLEMYIRKEVAVRHEYASEFFGGVLLVSLALSCVLMVGSLIGLHAVGRTAIVIQLVAMMGIAQILFNASGLLVAILHSRGTVNGLALINVFVKLLWGGGIIGALVLGFGIRGAGAAVLLAELFRAVTLSVLIHRQVKLRVQFDRVATQIALRGSLPFYVGSVAQTIYARLDLSIMSFLAPEREVGWYGAASTVGALSLMLSPVIGWVILPLTAKAAARATEELMMLGRRANELVMSIAFPTALTLYLFADELVALAFGQAYAPSSHALRILAPTFVLTYATIIYSSILIRLERSWAVTVVSLGGMAISPLLNVVLVPRFLAYYGDGGAGRAAATSLVVTEAYTTIVFVLLLGKGALDRRLSRMLLITLAGSLVTIAADTQLIALGMLRAIPDALIYLGIVIGTGALDVRAGLEMIRSLRTRRSGDATA